MTEEDLLTLSGRLNEDGTLSAADLEGYLNAVLDALEVHVDRERIRCGLWKEYPAKDQIDVMRIKVDRSLRSLELDPRGENPAQVGAVIGEMLDCINYAIFAIRILRGEFESR